MIEVVNLTKKFNRFTAVDNLSFSVKKGETLVLLGTSGCGKTTTLKMINRLIEATSGNILIDGKNIQDQKPETLRKKIGYVIQNIGLFPHYTVEQNIAVVPNLLKWDKKKISARVHELMALVGLSPDEFMTRKPDELSGGQQQRVGLARALVANPSVVLLDEPFGALDQITRRQIQREFANLGSLLEKTMILVTHDVFEAFELGDKICLMDQGQIKQIGSTMELIFSPCNDFVSHFFKTNRFQLELKVLSLKDIIEDIPQVEAKTELVQVFSDKTKILDVLEKLENAHEKKPVFEIKSSDRKRTIQTTLEGMMTAFYKKRAAL